MKRWALLDDEGLPVRWFDYPAQGSQSYPPPPKQLDDDDPEWDNPLF